MLTNINTLSNIMPITKNGFAISTLEGWEQRAGPKSQNQWVDGRSAKEVARAWLESGNSFPKEISQLLASNNSFGRILDWAAEPEAKLPFDNFPGEPRNSDLVVYAHDSFGQFLIAVEAKADEPFGETVNEVLVGALERRLKNRRSKGIDRIEQLVAALFEPRLSGEPPIKNMRYQLLTACAGALCEAERRGINRVVLLIHEFVTDKTVDNKHFANGRDLSLFLSRLSHGAVQSVLPGNIYGPFSVPGAPILSSRMNLFIGKAIRNLRGVIV